MDLFAVGSRLQRHRQLFRAMRNDIECRLFEVAVALVITSIQNVSAALSLFRVHALFFYPLARTAGLELKEFLMPGTPAWSSMKSAWHGRSPRRTCISTAPSERHQGYFRHLDLMLLLIAISKGNDPISCVDTSSRRLRSKD